MGWVYTHHTNLWFLVIRGEAKKEKLPQCGAQQGEPQPSVRTFLLRPGGVDKQQCGPGEGGI